MIGFAAQRLMDLEAEGVCSATHRKRNPDRVAGQVEAARNISQPRSVIRVSIAGPLQTGAP
jgi:heterodisulfide reductase subunit B